MESLIGSLLKLVENQLKEKGVNASISFTQNELVIKIPMPQNLKDTLYTIFGNDAIIEPEVIEIKVRKRT